MGVRASARMITSLARNPAWSDSITPELRRRLIEKLRADLENSDNARATASIARALGALEHNDIDRARLLLDAEKQESEGQPKDEARQLLADLDEIDRMEGRKRAD